MAVSQKLAVVILAGGSGSRLWPVSRDAFPKQLVSLSGGASLLQETAMRVQACGSLGAAQTIVVCQEAHRFVIAQQLLASFRPCSIVLEPEARNTAPALTLGALQAMADGDDPVLVVLPADHAMSEPAGFDRALSRAVELAAEGIVVTLGVSPLGPETGYGYIRCGAILVANTQVRAWKIDGFTEKPSSEVAEQMLSRGDHLWNAGIFVMRASVWMHALATCQPVMAEAMRRAWVGRTADLDFVRVPRERFGESPTDSIDYAVMEHLASAGPSRRTGLPGAAVVELDAGWSDVGSWASVWSHLERDLQGNAQQGDALLIDASDSLVIAQSRLVACVGVTDLVVVETQDAVLVMNRNRSQEVRRVVEQLRTSGRDEWRVHQRVHRPWGWYQSVDSGGRFQVKRIVVRPGAALSLQMHHHRAEHWIVVHGTAQVTCDDKTFLVSENESTYIPLGKRHRLENPGKLDLEMIEVQSGAYLGEDDIVRFDDVYGRA